MSMEQAVLYRIGHPARANDGAVLGEFTEVHLLEESACLDPGDRQDAGVIP